MEHSLHVVAAVGTVIIIFIESIPPASILERHWPGIESNVPAARRTLSCDYHRVALFASMYAAKIAAAGVSSSDS